MHHRSSISALNSTFYDWLYALYDELDVVSRSQPLSGRGQGESLVKCYTSGCPQPEIMTSR